MTDEHKAIVTAEGRRMRRSDARETDETRRAVTMQPIIKDKNGVPEMRFCNFEFLTKEKN